MAKVIDVAQAEVSAIRIKLEVTGKMQPCEDGKRHKWDEEICVKCDMCYERPKRMAAGERRELEARLIQLYRVIKSEEALALEVSK